MKLEFFRRLIDNMSRDQAEHLYAAIGEGRDELAARIRQCKEKDADDGMTPIRIASAYADDDREIAFLTEAMTRLSADLSVPDLARKTS